MTIIVCRDIEKNLDFTDEIKDRNYYEIQIRIEKSAIDNYLMRRVQALDEFMKRWQFTPYEVEQMGLTHNKLAKLRIKNHIKVEYD